MNYFRILVIVTFAAAVLNNSMSALAILGHAIAMVLMLYITKTYKLVDNISKYVILLTYWISLMFLPAFHLVKVLQGEDGAHGYKISPIDYEHILNFGSVILFLTCFSWIIFGGFGAKKRHVNITYKPAPISNVSVRIIFAIMYALSLFSLSIGLSRMGAEAVVLPFRLAGIITLLRIIFFPLLFATIVENFILRNKKIPKDYIFLFLGWSFLEVIVRLSKGALVSSFLPSAIIMYIYYKPKLFRLLRYALPVLMFFLFLYPIVEIMRSGDMKNLRANFTEASQLASEDDSRGGNLTQPLNRTFMIPGMYAKDYVYLDQNRFFDFSKAPAILAWGGTARYQTFVIDGYPLGVPHSSGTTGLEDPLLFGGYGLCLIVVALLMLFAFGIDGMSYRRMWSISVMLILLLWSFCNTQNITNFTDAVGLQYLVARFFAIWVAYRYNFSTRIINIIKK